MKYLIIFVLFSLIGFYPIKSVAQKNLSEPDKLKFEEAFFEALKQKAIGNFDKAITALEICQSLDSTNISVQFEMSKNFYWLKNYFEAQQTLGKALEKDGKNIWLLEHAKNIAVAQNDYKNAIAYQEKIIVLKPSKKIGLLNLYLAINDTIKAIDLIKIIKKEQGSSTQLTQIEKSLLNKKPVKKSETVTNNISLETLKAKYKSGKDFKTLKTILEIEEQQSDFKSLLKYALEGLELYPSQSVLYLFAAKANNGLYNYTEALLHLENGIDFVIDKLTQKKYYLAYSVSYLGLNNEQKANHYKKLANQL